MKGRDEGEKRERERNEGTDGGRVGRRMEGRDWESREAGSRELTEEINEGH